MTKVPAVSAAVAEERISSLVSTVGVLQVPLA
jgi:hypothetical protein